METLATSAWQDVRRFSEDLRPSYLEQLGLVQILLLQPIDNSQFTIHD